VRHGAAHHAHIGLHSDGGQPAAVEDAEVGVVMVVILLIQAVPVCVEAVAVQHGELAHADQPGARAGIVAPLGLDVVDQRGQLAVRLDLVAHQVGDDLFVGHRQHHVVVVLVLEATHLRADLVPAPGLFPQVSRMDHRHGDFLPADGVDLLTHDVLDFGHGAARQRQVAEDAGAQLADESGPQQELVAGDFAISRRLAPGSAEEAGHAHGLFLI
jgi:hypothetical protein